MKGPALLAFMRHARSLRNEGRKGVFWKDDKERELFKDLPDEKVPLAPEGWRELKETAPALFRKYGPFDVVINSGYLRTVQTMEGVLSIYDSAERCRVVIKQDINFRERESGFCYNMTEAEVREWFPWLDGYWKLHGSFLARPPGGESVADVCLRVKPGLNDIAKRYPGKKVLIVTHGRTVHACEFVVEGWTIEEMREVLKHDPANASLTVYKEDVRGELRLLERDAVYYSTTPGPA